MREGKLRVSECCSAISEWKNLLCAKSKGPCCIFYFPPAVRNLTPHFCPSVVSISDPEGDDLLKTNNIKTKDKSGATSIDGLGVGGLGG